MMTEVTSNQKNIYIQSYIQRHSLYYNKSSLSLCFQSESPSMLDKVDGDKSEFL